MFPLTFDTNTKLKELSQKEKKRYTYYLAKFGCVIDIVQNSKDFNALNPSDQTQTIKRMILQNKTEVNEEVERLLKILPQLLNTEYVRLLMQLVGRYNHLLAIAREESRKNIIQHYNKRKELVKLPV